MPCRGVRGATTVAGNNPDAILEATQELLKALIAANDLHPSEIASAVFTSTQDLTAAFPARAARLLGWDHVPLLDAAEMAVPGSLPLCIRVLLHWNTDRPAEDIRHAYLHGARVLRPEWACRAEEAVATPGEIDDSISVADPADHANPILEHQMNELTVAYQGEPGAYSQEAICQRFGAGTNTLACRSFEDIFSAVENGRASLGLLPIENSQTGSIHQSYDLLLDHDLQVVGEVKFRVRHCLLVPPGTRQSDILRVRSHPQALAQVEQYLKRHGWQAVPVYDTAGAARDLAANPEPGTAAIASALAGQIYSLDILESGVEDADTNTTRFFLLSRGKGWLEEPGSADAESRETPLPASGSSAVCATGPETELDGSDTAQANAPGYKTSLVFATTHTPGALHRALGEFASRGLNLTKIESRPRRNRPWHYVFYLDFESQYEEDPQVQQALIGLLSCAAFVKLLGSYPAAR